MNKDLIINILKRCLEEVQRDIVATAPDTIWTRDCISMTVIERIEIALEKATELQKDIFYE